MDKNLILYKNSNFIYKHLHPKINLFIFILNFYNSCSIYNMYKLKIKTMETVFEKFKNIRDILSDKTVLDELAQYMTSDSLSEFVEHLYAMYDVNL